jgi:GTP-binding protein Era
MERGRTRKKRETRAGRVAIVGRPNVGKSTLLNGLLGEPISIISHHPQTTRDAVRGVLTQQSAQIVFVDTPGLHRPRTRLGARMNAIARKSAREADVIVFVADAAASAAPTDEDLVLLRELAPQTPTVLVLNKVDRVKDKATLLPLLESYSKVHAFAAIVPMSAKRGDANERLLGELRALLPEGPMLYEPDTLSDQPTRFFVAEYVREQILAKTRQEVPHGVAVVVERFDEAARVTRIDLAVHVPRESHKKILIGARGATMKAIGTDARKRVEAMLGRHVDLRLWVRVTPDWYDRDDQMRALGYGDPT